MWRRKEKREEETEGPGVQEGSLGFQGDCQGFVLFSLLSGRSDDPAIKTLLGTLSS